MNPTLTPIPIDDALLLVEQNFYFLNAGEFFALWSRREDLGERVPRPGW